MSLLDKARAVRGKKAGRLDPERVELALAWFHGEVTTGQASVALGVHQGNAGALLATVLRSACAAGIVTITPSLPTPRPEAIR